MIILSIKLKDCEYLLFLSKISLKLIIYKVYAKNKLSKFNKKQLADYCNSHFGFGIVNGYYLSVSTF